MINTEQDFHITPEGTLDAKTSVLGKNPSLVEKLNKAAKKTAVLAASFGLTLLLLVNPSAKAEAASCSPATPENCDPTVNPDPACPRVNYLAFNAFALNNDRNIKAFVPGRFIEANIFKQRPSFLEALPLGLKPENVGKMKPDWKVKLVTKPGGKGYAELLEVKNLSNNSDNQFKVESARDEMGRPLVKVSMNGNHDYRVKGIDLADGVEKDLNAYGLYSSRLLTDGQTYKYTTQGNPESENREVPFDCPCDIAPKPTHVSHLQLISQYNGSDLIYVDVNANPGFYPPREAYDGK